jgi:hypothetical protein
MLHPDHLDYLARKERIKDLLREADRERLINTASLSYSRHWKPYRRLVGWLGVQLVTLGWQLQRYAGAQPTETAAAFHQALSGSEYYKR